MRLAISTLLLLAVAALGGGCREKAQGTKDAETKLRDAEATRAEAARAVRVEYVREASQRLTEFDAKMKELGDRVATATGQAKVELEKKYAATKGRRDAAGKRLDELKEATGDRWEKVKDGVGSAFEELKKSFD